MTVPEPVMLLVKQKLRDIDFEEEAIKLYDRAYLICDRLGVTRLVKKTDEQPDCERNIICNEARGCGRRRCPARTVTVSHYWRCLYELDFQRYILAKYCEEAFRRLRVGHTTVRVVVDR